LRITYTNDIVQRRHNASFFQSVRYKLYFQGNLEVWDSSVDEVVTHSIA